MSLPRVSIQTDDFDLSVEIDTLRRENKGVGAVCSFVGTVRDRNDGDPVSSMELEHYPGMTEKSIEAMVEEAFRRFDIFGARVIHRVGLLQPLDQIVLVAVTSAHRGQSFQACEFLMDYLKTQAPFWKKEQTPQGARWVDARVSDDAALARCKADIARGDIVIVTMLFLEEHFLPLLPALPKVRGPLPEILPEMVRSLPPMRAVPSNPFWLSKPSAGIFMLVAASVPRGNMKLP